MRICLNCGTEHELSGETCTACGGPVVEVRNSTAGDNFSGRVLANKYVLLRPIGRGGMGSVYQAKHRSLDKRVAIKILNVEVAKSQDALRRFYAEARNAGRLEHPHNVRVFDFGHEEDGLAYIVMEVVRGKPLSHLHMPLAAARALRMASQICSALQEAHDLGLVHRDLKPDNIMLSTVDGEDFCRVLDYGIAKETDSSTALTRTGVIVGTPQYLSPEQAEGRKVDHRSDIYALGAMLYEMVTGRLPFAAETALGFARAHLHDAPTPPRELVPLRPAIDELILDCLAKSPGDRPSSMDEVRRRIDAILAGEERVDTDTTEPDVVRSAALLETATDLTPPGSATSAETAGGALAPEAKAEAPATPALPRPAQRARPWLLGGLVAVLLAGAGLLVAIPLTDAGDESPVEIAAPFPTPSATAAADSEPEPPPATAGAATPSPTEARRRAEADSSAVGAGLAAWARLRAERIATDVSDGASPTASARDARPASTGDGREPGAAAPARETASPGPGDGLPAGPDDLAESAAATSAGVGPLESAGGDSALTGTNGGPTPPDETETEDARRQRLREMTNELANP